MTRKLEDMKNFINYIKNIGYRKQIHINHLRYFIAQKIGTSEYVMKNFIKLLQEFGFLKDAGIGVFDICDGWNPIKTKEEIDKDEKEAETEANKLIDKHSRGKPDD